MLWNLSLVYLAVLAFSLIVRPDGRIRFEAWVFARLVFDTVQLIAERTGHMKVSTSVWYLGVLICAPLLLLALRESMEAGGRAHREILISWTVLSLAAAWVRFFPYTGHAVVLIDSVASMLWISEKLIREIPHPTK